MRLSLPGSVSAASYDPKRRGKKAIGLDDSGAVAVKYVHAPMAESPIPGEMCHARSAVLPGDAAHRAEAASTAMMPTVGVA